MVPWRFDWNKSYKNLPEASKDLGSQLVPGWNTTETDTLYAYIDVFNGRVDIYVWNRTGVRDEMKRFVMEQSTI